MGDQCSSCCTTQDENKNELFDGETKTKAVQNNSNAAGIRTQPARTQQQTGVSFKPCIKLTLLTFFVSVFFPVFSESSELIYSFFAAEHDRKSITW
jgi:hypothetical protein